MSRETPSLLRYGDAILGVAVWLGGRRPGVVAVLLSLVVLHFVFIAPVHPVAIPHGPAYFVVLSLLAVLITASGEARHREPDPGPGSTFSFLLPAAPDETA